MVSAAVIGVSPVVLGAGLGALLVLGQLRARKPGQRVVWRALLAVWIGAALPLMWLASQADAFELIAITGPAEVVLVAGLIVTVAATRQRLSSVAAWSATLVAWLASTYLGLSWFTGPYVEFDVTAGRCGHQPVIASRVITDRYYYLPSDSEYRIGRSIFETQTYFCSEAEAQAAGYSRR